MTGKFIVIEGIDGAGKTTQVDLLVKKLRYEGIPAVGTREPGGCLISEELRKVFKHPASVNMTTKASLAIIFAARNQHINEFVIPNLKKGVWVICDRYVGSTLAYQYYANERKDVSIEDIKSLNSFFCEGIFPDLNIYIHIPAEISTERIKLSNRRVGDDRFDGEENFRKKLVHAFKEIANTTSYHWLTVQGVQSIDRVAVDIWDMVHGRFLMGKSYKSQV